MHFCSSLSTEHISGNLVAVVVWWPSQLGNVHHPREHQRAQHRTPKTLLRERIVLTGVFGQMPGTWRTETLWYYHQDLEGGKCDFIVNRQDFYYRGTSKLRLMGRKPQLCRSLAMWPKKPLSCSLSCTLSSKSGFGLAYHQGLFHVQQCIILLQSLSFQKLGIELCHSLLFSQFQICFLVWRAIPSERVTFWATQNGTA